MPRIYFVGVDVGTSSARAALVSSDGKVLRQHVQPIKIWNPEYEHFEQSSDDIWDAVCCCVRVCTNDVNKEEIVAISFDATCSLVILAENGEPLSVSKTRHDEQNVILWMDHRAHEEADAINATKHELLNYVGGQVSVEMEIPKLLWLRKNAYLSTWTRLWRAFDLPDFLTWRSTGNDSRSLCSVVCKWNYDAMNMCWNDDFLRQIGLEDLCRNNFATIGENIQQPGEPVGDGLSEIAAEELGLKPGTIVGTSLIDAHAGALGMFGCKRDGHYADDLEGKLALICGTSTCHMSLTREPCHAFGVWGPYRNAIIPDFYLNEGGQSATGLLLDHVIKTHPQYMHIKMKLRNDEHIYDYLNRLVFDMTERRQLDDPCYITKNLHVWPDLHGNRSPIADSSLRGMISGLSIGVDEESLAKTYLAFVQALAYGTRHIIENLYKHGRVKYRSLLFCGGLGKNELYVKCHVDICQLPAIIPNEQEMVLVGAAMLGACAAKVFENLEAASNAMGGTGQIIEPTKSTKSYHDQKYYVFLQMLEDQRKYKMIMEQVKTKADDKEA